MLDTLLVSSDPQLIATMQSACLKVGITPKVCAGLKQLAGVLVHKKIYCVILDDLDEATATGAMKTLQESPSSRFAVPMAIHSGSPVAIPRLMFSLAKPVAEATAIRSLRAAQGQMLNELRRYIRYPLSVPITLTSDRGQELQAVCRNLSQRGVGIQVPAQRITAGVPVQIQLALEPGVVLMGAGQVVWWDNGRAGIRCRGVTQRDQRQLEEWLASRTQG